MPDGSHGRWEPDFDADERTLLTGFLDYHRATLRWKAGGLTKDQMAHRVGASDLTLAGLVKHLALVEDTWFTFRFAGQRRPEPWAGVDRDADPDWDLRSALDDEPEALLALYDAACARSRAVIEAAGSLDQTQAWEGWEGRPLTLRWVLLHMIEETARHNGHADLLREAIDGETGE